MKRIAALAAVLAAAAAFALVAAGNGGGGDPYLVRAIFDNAGFIIPGEDVKIAGVKVGAVDSLDVTPEFKAAVVLRIDHPGYRDFRSDATCIIRPQSLIGEKFVECDPTQKRAPGAQEPGPLRKIDRGPGEGQYLLPVDHTEQSVDLDLINNTLRLPYRERLSLILNELGATVAGRGEDVRQVIRRADPALQEVDKVLEILASQNRQLQALARNGDTILAPLARERRHVSGALANSAAVAQATAERRTDLALDIQKLPEALRQLRPTMTRLGALSDEMTPVLADLHDAAPDINRFIIQLGPFSQAAIPAVDSLGETAKIGTPAITAARPVIRDLRDLGKAIKPVGLTARQLLESVQETGGIERAMDYIFYQVAAINGFDSFGHYLRAGLIVNTCSTYSITPVSGCSANFQGASEASAASLASAGPRDQVLLGTAEALRKALAGEKKKEKKSREGARRRRVTTPRSKATTPSTPAQPPTAAPAPTPTPAPTPAATPAPSGDSAADPLLDYLFGGDGK
jgi:phospholipid/cholesterol/gamma-HCH transport system substrate-binding protein